MLRGRLWRGQVPGLMLVGVALFASSLLAQTAAANTADEGETLHVYAHLIQIPVLALDAHQQQLPPIAPERFRVKFDHGPEVKPSVRVEGDDPITLGVLLDVSNARNALNAEMGHALAGLVPDALHAADRVAIYLTDGCKLLRFSPMASANATLLSAGVKAAMERRSYGPQIAGSTLCGDRVGTWGAISRVAKLMATEPGRRVILAISDGASPLSAAATTPGAIAPETEESARSAATGSGVVLFSIAEKGRIAPAPTPEPVYSQAPNSGGTSRLGQPGTFSGRVPPPGPPPLVQLSEATGGLVLEAEPDTLDSTLRHFVDLVRGRYILEFTRPAGLRPQEHLTFAVSFGVRGSFIRAGGTTITTSDPGGTPKAGVPGIPAKALPVVQPTK